MQVNITVDAGMLTGESVIRNHGLGQGGLSDDPNMISDHISQIKNLNPKYIRLFLQEYYDLYPEHNVYNWSKLDAVIDAILKTGAKPLMCICFKPKVLYPSIDHVKVHPSSYEEWDELIYRLVSHYNVERKDGIVYWEVANEPDIGEPGGCPYLFSGEDYCVYYEHTVKAMLQADKNIKVGGPALAWFAKSPIQEPWLEYCNKKNIPVDFISWHFYSDDATTPFAGATYFRKLLEKCPSLKPELIIDEWNISLQWTRIEPEFQPCFILEVVNNMLKAGIDYSFYYQIRDYHVNEEQISKFLSKDGTKFMVNWWNEKLQRDGLFDFQGMTRPAYFVFKMLGKMSGKFIRADSDLDKVKAIATYNPEREVTHIIIWNFEEKKPPKRTVKLYVKNLKNKEWGYTRFKLDTKTTSNMENDRMVLSREIKGKMTGMEDDFEVLPYGIHFVVINPLI
jgi:hypothetical protein